MYNALFVYIYFIVFKMLSTRTLKYIRLLNVAYYLCLVSHYYRLSPNGKNLRVCRNGGSFRECIPPILLSWFRLGHFALLGVWILYDIVVTSLGGSFPLYSRIVAICINLMLFICIVAQSIAISKSDEIYAYFKALFKSNGKLGEPKFHYQLLFIS